MCTLFGDHKQLIKKVPDILQHTERAEHHQRHYISSVMYM